MSDCVFCQIAAGKIPAQKVYEDEQILAFEDIRPQARVHVLVIPKKHIAGFQDLSEEDASLMGHLSVKLPSIAALKGIQAYRLIVNCGKEAGQEVFHLHWHLLGGESLGKMLCIR